MNVASTRDKIAAIQPPTAFLKVGGAIDFDAALGAMTTFPSAFVVPLAESGSPNDFEISGYQQEVGALIGVVIAVRDVGDRTGEGAIDEIEVYRKAVRDALVNWEPYPGFYPFNYSGGQLLGFKDGAMFWQDEFETTYTITK